MANYPPHGYPDPWDPALRAYIDGQDTLAIPKPVVNPIDGQLLQWSAAQNAWVPANAPTQAGAVLYNMSQTLTNAQMATARNNIGAAGGVLPFFQVGDYGAKGDGVTDDAAAIQAAINDANLYGGGVVVLSVNPLKQTQQFAVGTPLVLKQGVILTGGLVSGKISEGKAHATLLPHSAFPAGSFMITGTNVNECGVINVYIYGGVVNSGSKNVGGIKVSGNWNTFNYNNVGATSLGCIIVDGNSVACEVRSNNVQNFWNFRTLTSAEGALWVKGTDHYIEDNQCNGGHSLTANISSTSDPTVLYQCGMLFQCNTSFISGNNGEYSECGVRVEGKQNVFRSLRSDTNPGVGIVTIFDGTGDASTPAGGFNIFQGVFLMANNLAPNVKSGVLPAIYTSGFAEVWDGLTILADWTGSGAMSAVGIQENQYWIPSSGDWAKYKNVYRNIQINPGAVRLDWTGSQLPYNVGHGTYGPAKNRPAALQAAGAAWSNDAGYTAYSNGVSWFDASHLLVGNMYNRHAADGLNFTSDTFLKDFFISPAPSGPSCTIAAEKMAAAVFQRPCNLAATVTAAGVTQGYIDFTPASGDYIETMGTTPVSGYGAWTGWDPKAQGYTCGMLARAEIKGGGSAPQVRFKCLQFNGGTLVSTQVGSWQSIPSSGTAGEVGANFPISTAGATTAFITVEYNSTGMAAGDVLHFAKLSLFKNTQGNPTTAPVE